MDSWIKTNLEKCLSFPIPEEMVQHICSIAKPNELAEYFSSLLDLSQPMHSKFLEELMNRMFGSRALENSNPKSKKIESVQSKAGPRTSGTTVQTKKKKTKFVNIYSEDGKDVMLLKGRHRCECQATKHKFINNCLKCGRIICEQEGSGPCLFCGSIVCTEEENNLISSGTQKGNNFKKTLQERERPEGWEEALIQRNKLLEFDKASEKRTRVIDDEQDYYKSNSIWLSNDEREKLSKLEAQMRESKHGSRLKRNMKIDIFGNELKDENISVEEQIMSIEDFNRNEGMYSVGNMDPNIDNSLPEVVYVSHTGDQGGTINTCGSHNKYDGVYNRIQDKELLELSDMRSCLSMHQPWASLLIAGIKKHEGRSWYSSHRGRLWIAATAKPVTQEDIDMMEQFYKRIYNDNTIEYPKQYPSGCLLGFVSVDDCLPQEEYRRIYPNGESDSPYVFVCKEFQSLPVRFPIKGMHKIYKLDPSIHTAAIKCLQKIQ